jgi:hypothetical protein
MPVSVRQSVSSRGRLDRPPSQTNTRVDTTLRVGERTIGAIYSKKKRRLAEQTAASLSVQGPDLDRSRLAVMTANDDPLDVRIRLSVSGADAEGRPSGFRQYVKLAFAIQSHW